MVVDHQKEFFKAIWYSVRTKFRNHSWEVLVTWLFGMGGILATIIVGYKDFVPWHLSLVLLVLVCSNSWFCSKFYKLRNQREQPSEALESLHIFAETLRKIQSGECYKHWPALDSDSLTSSDLDKLIDLHLGFAQSACANTKQILNALGVPAERVCVKIICKKRLVKVASHKDTLKLTGEHPLAEQCEFWRLIFNTYFVYDRWKSRPNFRNLPQNKGLREKPKFLALGGLDKDKPSEAFIELAQEILRDRAQQQPSPVDFPELMWQSLKNKREDQYVSCIGVMISGPAFYDPISSGASSSKDSKAIGFIGIDAQTGKLLDFLEQKDLHGVAAVADALYPHMTRLQRLIESRNEATKSDKNAS